MSAFLSRRLRDAACVTLLAATLAAQVAWAQLGGPPPPDPQTVLAQAKAASGAAAWDGLRTQHSVVDILAGPLSGRAERWSDTASGHSTIVYAVGPVEGAAGYDARGPWIQEGSNDPQDEPDATARELAVNAAYRDRLAFWYPERAKARIAYKERAEGDGAFFDVIRITPEGGRPFELWINTETHLIERLVEREALAVRTEQYMDMRTVQGVTLPFRVRASRDGGQRDEVVTVQSMTFNEPLPPARRARPAKAPPDFAFPAGRDSVEVPFEFVDGHVFVHATLDGKRARLLVDSGGRNVLLPAIVTAAGTTRDGAAGEIGVARVAHMTLGGVTMSQQAFATVDLAAFLRRVEGADDIAGVLGVELFTRLVVKLDYVRQRMTLFDPARYRYDGKGTTLEIPAAAKTPQVMARVDGAEGPFRLDTGNRGSLTLSPTFARATGIAERHRGIEAVHGASVGGPIRATIARSTTLTLGDIDVAGPLTAVVDGDIDVTGGTDAAGSIGNGVLRRFDVVFDLPHRAVHLERNAAFAAPDVFDRAGLWIERGARGFDVVDVVAGSPAAAAGLAAGDTIIAIDGKPATATSLAAARAQLRGAPGRKLRLTLASGAVRVVTLRDLV